MSDDPLRILVVCTANICRSPVAERLLGRHLTQRGAAVEVRSAGTSGGHLDVHRDTLAAANRVSIDMSDHVSRAVNRTRLVEDGADLVLAMTREHLRSVVALEPSVWPRSFTLKELVRRGSVSGPRGTTETLDEWYRRVAQGRRAADLMRPDPLDDLADPYGGPASGHVVMVDDIDRLTAQLARLMMPT
jgi:protein-tyrosine phosphatase